MLNSNVDYSVYSRQDYAQDEIILNLVLLVSLRTSFPCPDFHGLTLWIKTTYHGRVWSWDFFQYHQLPPCPWVVQRNVTSSGCSANELVPRVMTLLAGNHVDLPDRGTCHMSPIHSFVSFQMSGPIAYK